MKNIKHEEIIGAETAAKGIMKTAILSRAHGGKHINNAAENGGGMAACIKRLHAWRQRSAKSRKAHEAAAKTYRAWRHQP